MKQDVFFWFKELMKIEMKKKSLISIGTDPRDQTFNDRKKKIPRKVRPIRQLK